MTKTDTAFTARYTMPDPGQANDVKVADFRDAIDHLFRICNVDLPACVGSEEKARWVEIARRFARELRNTTCKRANGRDWDRREAALERSATLIAKVLGL